MKIRHFPAAAKAAAKRPGIVFGVSQSASKELIWPTTTSALPQVALAHLKTQATAAHVNGSSRDVKVFYGVPSNENGQTATVALVGLGQIPDANSASVIDRSRHAAATGARTLHASGCTHIAVDAFGDAQALAEGAQLGVFRFTDLKTDEESLRPPVSLSCLSPDQQQRWQKGIIYADAQNKARRWMEMPANVMTPTQFCLEAESLFQGVPDTTLSVRDESWCRQMKMNAFLAVSQGSRQPLRFLELHYRGRNQHETVDVALVGKGVCFDSGGISIKPSAGMALMRGDMGGAAVTLATLYGVSKLKLPVNVSAFIPLCENMPDGRAIKPGDVVYAMNGKSIEIDKYAQ